MIEGGVSVNTIAPFASLTLDLRSVDQQILDDLEARVDAIVREAADSKRAVIVRRETIGDRPGGSIPEEAPIVQTTLAVLRELGVESHLDAGSTDANIPIAEGIPAICIGLTNGRHAHRTDEYIEVQPVGTGLKQLALLVARLANSG
jgi:acetylornithine deacetylase/succinyl-diaminopimelate desuccinylase-like protein